MSRVLLIALIACKSPSPPGAIIPTTTDDTDTDANSDTDTDTDLENCEDEAGMNRQRETAVPLVEGANYRVESENTDWFTFQVPAATEVVVDITFAFGDIDARLRSEGVQASAITSSPNEQLVWHNTGGQVTAELEIYAYGFQCIPYDVEVTFN